MEALVDLKVNDAKIAPHPNVVESIVERHSPEPQGGSPKAVRKKSPLHWESKSKMTRNLSQASKVTLESPLNLNTIKITDEGDRDQNRFDTHVTLQTPDLTTPALLEQNKSLESLINSAGSAYETQEEKRLKIDLSNVSFLKPHVMNPKTYELAHQGHTRE